MVQDASDRLKLLGTRVAIDAVGTGYSNSTYLHKLEVDRLKLDDFFIKGLEKDHPMAQLVDSLNQFK